MEDVALQLCPRKTGQLIGASPAMYIGAQETGTNGEVEFLDDTLGEVGDEVLNDFNLLIPYVESQV